MSRPAVSSGREGAELPEKPPEEAKLVKVGTSSMIMARPEVSMSLTCVSSWPSSWFNCPI